MLGNLVSKISIKIIVKIFIATLGTTNFRIMKFIVSSKDPATAASPAIRVIVEIQ